LGAIERYDVFSTALQQLSLIGIWNEKPLLDGQAVKKVLPGIPKGPAFRDVMEEQRAWMITHPGAPSEPLEDHLRLVFVEFATKS
jgi:hypothetical protein